MDEKTKEFISTLTPSNYFITKSMEISKIETSGTLWYLKKFLVLYDSIFLSKTIKTGDGIKRIIGVFESYIKSLPEEQQAEAELFFFPKNIDIRKNYKTYMSFAGMVEFNNKADINKHFALVNKYYFVYLMNLGGQSGVKAYLREKIYSDDFEVKYLTNYIHEYKKGHPECTYSDNQIINDYHAALRNERQILFYYRFVHSRSNGTKGESEFCSLTPIGELALCANSNEFRIIWEHQKLKMISQPITIDFPSVSNCLECDYKKFKLNFSPYLTILKCFSKNNEIDNGFYNLVLSRTNNENTDEILENYQIFKENIDYIQEKIESFGVRSDVASEDFDKEIKKYLLGIRDDFSNDKGTNPYGLCSKKSKGWQLNDRELLNKILSIYVQIDNYKVFKYSQLYRQCEEELQKKYHSIYSNFQYELNHKIKMHWDLYNIHYDKVITLALLVMDYIVLNNLEIIDVKINQIVDSIKEQYPNIIKAINLTSKKDLKETLKIIVESLETDGLCFVKFEDEFNIEISYVNEYSSLTIKDIMRKLVQVSEENVSISLERKRDSRVINLMRTLYVSQFSDEKKLVKCECCGEVTFLKQNDEPYLEFHHLIPYNIAYGPDHFENIFGICPMCHRKIHNGKDSLKEKLYESFDLNNHFRKKIFDRLKNLYKHRILKSYHLEYALTESIINEEEYQLITT